ncbi:aspartate aminotransferase family protein [Nocardiopsis aegyptia]|uniref:Acetylornithine/succinyldiaminopimelate/putresci ne aminotransferase n=1 Tax=Nocardiopsis aegyptia TaxID=220378 RepID=A0A7Z0EQB1_9ACTN|nr:aminotransferase class III-fold pyridoxal phosphate-dependent enzyme [Nocardiopsis aegyptia]NYJ35766.1 acetylornithine/succinyldiaminopimelate/putrescine aminotransferase [Nocardiopsis aegyptia]
MNPEPTDRELAEPHLLGTLATVGVNVEYVRAHGDTLYRLDEEGREIPVTDFAGGYGALILGHNHPEITALARDLLERQVPVYTQFSRHPAANRAAHLINDIIRRETGTEEPYFAFFSSTGAEAVEAATKHAEFVRSQRLAALATGIDGNVASARAAVAAGRAEPGPDVYERAGADTAQAADQVLEHLVARLERHNDEVLSRPPVYFALEGSFHGKLAGSVQLTHNPGFRTPFAAMAARARFVPMNEGEALVKAVEEERAVVWDLVVEDGRVGVVERPAPVFGAFLVEPIQGEGGIHEVGREFAERIQTVCAEIECPIIVDEVQSGMGRTGSFLASARIGLRGDYYALAKSLGGGIAKSSVMLVREQHYRAEFELVHSSTFAKDGFSTPVAVRVLELLEADGGAAYSRARERGERLRLALERVREDFPDVVAQVRGRGLMLGLEFRSTSDSPSELFRFFAEADVLGYVLSGYLLREHDIRALPTASAVNTLRLAPSIGIGDEQIDRLEQALRNVALVLRESDEQALAP